VLLIVSEDNGPELGCYGDPYANTPNLDRLADEGVRFERAYVPYAVCSQSRASLFTSLYPHQNGQIGLATHRFAMYKDWPNIPSLLKDAGYYTGIIGKLHVNPEDAFPFDFRWNQSAHISFNHRNMMKIAEAAGDLLEEAENNPFFLMVNFPDAHYPLLRQEYGIPEDPLDGDDVKTMPWLGVDTPRIREYAANYYNCLARLDVGVGLVLDELEKADTADNTIIIYMGDHGAQFSRGKTSVYEAGLRVPLIVHWPGNTKAGIAPNQLVSTIDILPTILEATGIEAPDHLEGRPLQPLLQGEDTEWREYVFGQHGPASAALYYVQRSVRDDRYRLIVSPLRDRPNTLAEMYRIHHGSFFAAGCETEEVAGSSPEVQAAYATYHNPPLVELYDHENDPYEFNNVADDPEYADVRARLEAALTDWQERTNDPLRHPEVLDRMTEEMDWMRDNDPKMTYRKNRDFYWQYPDYFGVDHNWPWGRKRK
jgi:N-sulfoglucosamine sulfohydrolase